MTKKFLTHKDLAEHIGVSETTIKSYRRKFPGCIPVASNGKPIRFTHEAAEVAQQISEYFKLGMSVEDVRKNLAQKFSWIQADGKKKGGAGQHPEKQEVPSELAIGVSNMAKSMVALVQQQKMMLERIQDIEKVLESALGRSSGHDGLTDGTSLLHRVEAIDATMQKVMAGLAILTKKIDVSDHSHERHRHDKATHSDAHAGEIEKDIRPTQPSSQNDLSGLLQDESVEPTQHFLELPLVVRTAQNQYISAGGRNRGRFCVNDLKTMLAENFPPPNNFAFRWETKGQGWWLTLEQPGIVGGQLLHLLMMEVPTQGGTPVIEILQVRNNNQGIHPVEICAIIDSLSK